MYYFDPKRCHFASHKDPEKAVQEARESLQHALLAILPHLDKLSGPVISPENAKMAAAECFLGGDIGSASACLIRDYLTFLRRD